MSAEDTLLKCGVPVSERSQLTAASTGERLVGPYTATFTPRPVGLGPKVSESPVATLAAGFRQALLG